MASGYGASYATVSVVIRQWCLLRPLVATSTEPCLARVARARRGVAALAPGLQRVLQAARLQLGRLRTAASWTAAAQVGAWMTVTVNDREAPQLVALSRTQRARRPAWSRGACSPSGDHSPRLGVQAPNDRSCPERRSVRDGQRPSCRSGCAEGRTL